VEQYYPVAIVTLLSGLTIFGMALAVARIHGKTGIHAPVMTGHPTLERAVRAHTNTIEWVPVFLPALWLFAIYWSPSWAAAIGLVWVIARIIYFVGYVSRPKGRYPGFLLQTLAASVLLFGALGRIVWLWAA